MRLRSIFFLGLVALAGCQRGCEGPLVTDLVVITYRPLFNFNEWEVRATNGEIISRGKIDDGVYMRFRIVSIKNNDSKAKLFHFDPNKIYAADASERPVNPVIGLSGALAFDVAPGTIFTNRLNVTIKAKGKPDDIKNQVELLHYASGAGEHVLMASEDPKATSVPYVSPLRIPGANVN
jgi:hypothetical protein